MPDRIAGLLPTATGSVLHARVKPVADLRSLARPTPTPTPRDNAVRGA